MGKIRKIIKRASSMNMRTWLKKRLPERIPAFAAIFYNLLPARMFQPHYQHIAQEISLNKDAILVDVGTGPGWLPIRIAERFPEAKIIGIDLSEKMIEIAKKNNVHNGPKANLDFRVMDARALAFVDQSLDMVISTGAMHHWKEPVKILNEIYRCLKKGGEAWVYDGYGNASAEAIDRDIQPFFPGFPPRQLVRRILGIHGFSQKEYDTTVKEMISQTNFKTCFFENRGVMMRLRLPR
jgi:ubiquinone/menaquinone biosynthesis C-methylase UbiE